MMLKTLNKTGKKLGIEILYALFQRNYEDVELEYDIVDEFYADLGYDYELGEVLLELGINGTSDLLEEFEKVSEGK